MRSFLRDDDRIVMSLTRSSGIRGSGPGKLMTSIRSGNTFTVIGSDMR